MRSVVAILNKLLRTLEESYLRRLERAGREIAQRVCEIAWKWGNSLALAWKYDMSFVRFLGLNVLNG
jgi:hypothetical protein